MKEERYYMQTAAQERVDQLKNSGHLTAMYYSYRGLFIVKWKL